ncbi:type VI secretion system tip protein VgrG [Burkholderia sp. FERM BP-3421]|uniref:type VI secretion system Vgr family protein n=1 Tax=Burkholderia sp. FERM BP-3421 TaxID=1494466 RepID=UPI00235E3D38|nr:type VI secretion system Vgr family protein [Burkholderia sp. FERM BP-3421]WDD96533.1 type VI secretion system tip protein VgrG [Burkholderia sp. FERM BP-3421]
MPTPSFTPASSSNPLEGLSSMFANFDQLWSIFSQSQRQLQVQLAPSAGLPGNVILPHELVGSEGICEPLHYTLRWLSTDVRLPLKAFNGVPIAFRVGDFTGARRTVSAIVTSAHQLASDGGFVLNEFVCRDALTILEHRTTWRVYRAVSIIDITRDILSAHRDGNGVLGNAFEFDMTGLTSTYPVRAFTMQAGESDAAFLMRHWRFEGICWYFTHDIKDGWPVHTLHLVDNVHAWRDNPAGTVRFHRADATERDDTITSFQAHRHLMPGAVFSASPDYRVAGVREVGETGIRDQGKYGNAFAVTLTDYRYDSPHVADDLRHYEQINRRRQQAHEQRTKHFTGEGVVRAFSGGAGTVFSLSGHAEMDQHPAEQRRLVLTRVETRVRNHLLTASPGKGPLALDADSADYLNRFECVRADIPIVPAFDPSAVPSVGPMSARVVGGQGLEIDVDADGRIAVRFPFARSDEHPRAGASGTPRDSARIRYALPWADNRAGTALWPRVGSEVLVVFQQNDPDKPIAIATMHDAHHAPAQFSGAGSLPANAALYGIRSKEVGGTGYGELLFDDTSREIKTKLSSEHGKTQLNQGWIGHPREDGLSEPRGEGFELRSDLPGAIRASQLLISTDARPNAKGAVLDRQELIGQLEAALAIAKQLADLSSVHEADGTDTAPQEKLVERIKQWDGGSQDGAAIALSAPDGIALSSPQGVMASAGTHVDVVAVQDVNVSTGRRILMRAAQGLSAFAKAGMKLIAGTGDVVVQAQQGRAEIGASERMHLYSLKELVIEAPSIVFRSNGVTQSFADGEVLTSSSGAHTIQSSGFSHVRGGGGTPDLPHMPASTMRTDEQFAVASRNGNAYPPFRHEVIDETRDTRDAGALATDGTNRNVVQDAQIRPLTFIPKP